MNKFLKSVLSGFSSGVGMSLASLLIDVIYERVCPPKECKRSEKTQCTPTTQGNVGSAPVEVSL